MFVPLLESEGVIAVFDGVGKDTFLADFDLLRRRGSLVLFGNASGPPPEMKPLTLAPKSLRSKSILSYLY